MKKDCSDYLHAQSLLSCSKATAADLVRRAKKSDNLREEIRLALASLKDPVQRIEFRSRYGAIVRHFV